jgi:TRAP transporter TAXI family solute receptor
MISALFIAGIANAQSRSSNFEKSVNVAQSTRYVQTRSQREDFVSRLNANTVTIVSGNPNGSYLYFAYDIAAVLDHGNKLRILPIVGKGGAQNVKDVLYLRGVDMGITQSVVLRHYAQSGELGRNITDRLRYIARLSNEEMHLLVRSDINDIKELKGKRVNFSDIGSGTQVTARLMFKDLKIPVREVNMGQGDAFVALKRGKIDATFLISAKPSGSFSKLRPDPAYKIIPIPYSAAVQEYALPALLTHKDYPEMIPEGKPINTLAVSTVLAVFNWPSNTERYRRVAKFTEAFFKNFDTFMRKPRHPKWKEVNLAAEMPGWKRFPAAKEIIERDKNKNEKLKRSFDKFISKVSPKDEKKMSEKRREELFARFLEWQAKQSRR